LVGLLGFILFIPNVDCISDTVYLEKWDVTEDCIFELNKGDLIIWEFRTYGNAFIAELRAHESNVFMSHGKTSDKGILEISEDGLLSFFFENVGDTGGGFLEFEIKIQVRISGYSLMFVLMIISLFSVISIKTLKKNTKHVNYKSNKKKE
jgi:hypothetical protein